MAIICDPNPLPKNPRPSRHPVLFNPRPFSDSRSRLAILLISTTLFFPTKTLPIRRTIRSGQHDLQRKDGGEPGIVGRADEYGRQGPGGACDAHDGYGQGVGRIASDEDLGGGPFEHGDTGGRGE